MISKDYIRSVLDSYQGGEDFFVVEINVNKDNVIRVFVDRTAGITIGECSKISRFIQDKLDRDKEDFDLTVSSPGLDRPLRVWEQYQKNIGRVIKVKQQDGSDVKGTLTAVDQTQIVIEEIAKKHKKKAADEPQTPSKKVILFHQIERANVVLTI